MYTTTAEYEAYTSNTAPGDYERQELYATTLFKSVYPNFPSEDMMADLPTATQDCIKMAIFEQIDYAGGTSFYGGSSGGGVNSYSVGNFSISDTTTSSNEDKVGMMAKAFLDNCGVTFKGVIGRC